MEKGFISYILLMIVVSVIVVVSGISLASLSNPVDSLNTLQVIEEVDPEGQYKNARDTRRRSDLLAILNVIYEHAAEHNGTLPGDRAFPVTPICIGTSPKCFDLGSEGIDTVVPTYIAEIPKDPLNGTEGDTGYTIYVVSCTDIFENSECGRVVATAKGELESEIKVAR